MANKGLVTVIICGAMLGMMRSGGAARQYIPSTVEDDMLLERANLEPFERRYWGPMPEELAKRMKPIGDAQRKEIRSYHCYDLEIDWRNRHCLLRVKKNIEGGRTKLLARWSGENEECGVKIHEVTNAIKDTLREQRYHNLELLAESEQRLREQKSREKQKRG